MALAKGEAVVVVVEGEALAPDAPGVVPLPGVWVLWASRLAFCSSTLGKDTKCKKVRAGTFLVKLCVKEIKKKKFNIRDDKK